MEPTAGFGGVSLVGSRPGGLDRPSCHHGNPKRPRPPPHKATPLALNQSHAPFWLAPRREKEGAVTMAPTQTPPTSPQNHTPLYKATPRSIHRPRPLGRQPTTAHIIQTTPTNKPRPPLNTPQATPSLAGPAQGAPTRPRPPLTNHAHFSPHRPALFGRPRADRARHFRSGQHHFRSGGRVPVFQGGAGGSGWRRSRSGRGCEGSAERGRSGAARKQPWPGSRRSRR